MLTVDRLRFLLDSYDKGMLTKHEVVGLVYDDIFKEIVDVTADGNEFMIARSVCNSGEYPPTIKLEVDYNPFLLVAKRINK